MSSQSGFLGGGGGNVSYRQIGSVILPVGAIKGDILLDTDNGLSTGNVVDIYVHDGTAWKRVHTETEAQVKLNGSGTPNVMPASTGWTAGVPKQFSYGTPLNMSATPTTQYPVRSNYPIYNNTLNTFLEDPIPGLLTMWRIIYGFSNKPRNSNIGVSIGFVNANNPGSTFVNAVPLTLPKGITASQNVNFTPLGATANVIRPVRNTIHIMTIADNLSIGTGYKLFGVTTQNDATLTITIDSVTKISLHKQIRV